jgi:NAD(P)-dependent dehydrogenase (short-subunit alcohol dehydrogenase family)
MGKLNGKVAVITGSTRGLGFAIARAFAQEGAAVVVSSRSQPAVEKAALELRQQGARAAGLACEVSDLEQVRALARLAVETFGRIDIWVNNAGTAGPYGPTAAISPEKFTAVLNTNITGTYFGSLTALRYFIPQHSGKLINILGRGDDTPVPMQNAYASTKTWALTFTRALAKENAGNGVDIFAFNPGLMDTEMMSQVEAITGYEARMKPLETVMRIWANPPSVAAEKAVWLASAQSDGKSGRVVRILSPWTQTAGLLKAGFRVVFRRPGKTYPLNVVSVPSDLEKR